MARKLIIVPCGSGVATSMTAAEKLKDLLRQRRIDAEVRAVDFKGLRTYAATADLIVSIAPYEKVDYGVPVINGIPFLTGVGLEQTMDEVEKVLKGGRAR